MVVFVIIWLGQLVSLTGTQLTGFALGVWVFQQTGSVTHFAFITVCTMLPGIILSPLGGALVDRWDRRWVMILSDTGAGFSTLLLFILLFNNRLDLWHIYLLTAISSTCGAFQLPAYLASTTLLVPKHHLGRANGMIELARAVAQILAPALGGILLTVFQLWGVIVLDFATFLFALVTLLFVRIPSPEASSEHTTTQHSLWSEIVYGWRYIAVRPGLLGLLLFFAVVNFTVGNVIILLTPLILSFASPVVLGTVMSVAGVGMLFGSLVMSLWGGPERRVMGILGFVALDGLLLLLGGLQPNAVLIAAVAFVFLFTSPIIEGCDRVIWQHKVAPDVQGRAFAVQHAVCWSSIPLAYLVAGPLADHVFEPLLAADGALAGSVGRIIGVGPGRGIALQFMLMGVLTLVATVAAYLYPRLRLVEQELPDVIAETTL